MAAAVRETKEEIGLSIPAAQWRQVGFMSRDGYQMTTFAAVTDKMFCARACEEEPVWHLHVSSHQEFAAKRVNQYAPDFLESLSLALNACSASSIAAA